MEFINKTVGHVQTNVSKDDILESIKERDQLCYDVEMPLNNLMADHEEDKQINYFEVNENLNLIFSNSSLVQLLNRHKIPSEFYTRCPVNIKQDIFNYFVRGNKSTMLFRMMHHPEHYLLSENSRYIRACLTLSYNTIDDKLIFPTVFEALNKYPQTQIVNFLHDECFSRMLIKFKDIKCKYQDIEHHGGLLITNSETGHSAVWIEPVVMLPMVQNCMFVNRDVLKRQGFQQRIIHKQEVKVQDIITMVDNAYKLAQVGVVQVMEAWNQKVTKEHAFQIIENALPTRFCKILEEEWKETEEISKAIIAREILLIAATLPIFQRIQVEQAAGRVIGLFNNYATRFAQITEEIHG